MLHPEDLAADKTLALWGRAEPREFLDVIMLRERYGGARLLELAAGRESRTFWGRQRSPGGACSLWHGAGGPSASSSSSRALTPSS